MKKAYMKGRVLGPAVFATLVLACAMAVAGGGKPRARAVDLVNTKVRNALINFAMDVIPKPMTEPATLETEPFSYFLRPSFQLGVRGEPFATQVIDGHLWTGAAEWVMLAGEPLDAVDERIWTLHKGYLPCVSYSVMREGVEYTLKAFQFPLKGDKPGAPPVNFIKITATNKSGSTRKAGFGAGFMYGIKDHRSQEMRQQRFNPFWKYEIRGKAAIRAGKAIYAWNKEPHALMKKPGKRYDGPFMENMRDDLVCIAAYGPELSPGQTFSAEFALPHYPSEPALADELSGASFNERLRAFERFWEGWLARGASFTVPEQKVADASRSYVVHALMSQDVISDDEVEQHVNRLQYNRFWLRDSAFFTSMYEKWGYPDVGHDLVRHFFAYQRDDGNFVSQKGQLDGWGQAMWAFGTHVRYTGDKEFAKEAMPYVVRAVAWLERALSEDEWGLMPPTDAFDNEMILGRYTGHNFWALTGLDAGVDVCYAAGRDELCREWEGLRSGYFEHFMEVLRGVAAERGGVIPPGLDVPGGTDWGNLLAVYPGLLMDPHDPLVTGTFERYRKERMAEKIAMWQKSMHHYITERVAQTYLIRGEQEKVLDMFYGMLLHTGSCHEGFEWSIFPWDGRDYCINAGLIQLCNFPPHGWYAACLNMLFRNMLVREQGEELHLCSALSPEWTKPGDRVVVKEAPTPFGKVSFELDVDESSAMLEFEPHWREPPERVTLHLPYFFKLSAASVNGSEVSPGAEIELPAKGCTAHLSFKRLPAEQMSYQSTVEWYKREYRERL